MDVSNFERSNFRKIKRFFTTNGAKKMFTEKKIMYILNRIIGEDSQVLESLKKCYSGDIDSNFRFPQEDCSIISFPDIDFIQMILSNYKLGQNKPNVKIYMIPRLTEALSAYLLDDDFYFKEAEICLFGNPISERSPKKRKQQITIESLNIDFLPLETDFITMFSSNYIPRLWAFNELTAISEISEALEAVKINCNGFASITSVGEKSQIIAKNFCDINPEKSTTHLILFDRSIDFMTPLLSQSGYEGLVAELYGIHYGMISYVNTEQKNVTYVLSSQSDHVIGKLRLFNFSEEEQYLKEAFVEMQEHYKKGERPDLTNFNSKQQIENFKQESQFALDHKAFKVYFDINQNVSNALSKNRWYLPVREQEISLITSGKLTKPIIDKMIFYGADFRRIIRLICLDYVVNGHIDKYENIVDQLYANYGLQQIPFLMRLKQMNLLSPEPNTASNFRTLSKDFNLIAKSEHDDAAKHYLGFSPLIVRFVERLYKGNSETYQEICKDLLKQGVTSKQFGQLQITPETNILICFVGGCTHSEINLLRRISTRDHINMNFFTTRLFTPNEFMDDIASGIPGWDKVINP